MGGLPPYLDFKIFKSYFMQFGDLEDCVILKDKKTQKQRGFGFVTFVNIESVKIVLKNQNNHILEGKHVECKSAIPLDEMSLIQT